MQTLFLRTDLNAFLSAAGLSLNASASSRGRVCFPLSALGFKIVISRSSGLCQRTAHTANGPPAQYRDLWDLRVSRKRTIKVHAGRLSDKLLMQGNALLLKSEIVLQVTI